MRRSIVTALFVTLITVAPLSGQETPPEPELAVSTETPLVLRVCGQCHPAAQRITKHRKSADEWADVVTDMQGRGMTAPDQDLEQIVGYLATHYGRRESAPSATAQPPALVLRNATLIDGRGGPPLAAAALVVENGRVTWVGPAADVKASAGATVQDLAGMWIMPGIINLHAHVAESDGITQDPKTLFTRENVTANLQLYARYGVTSVASMGTDQPLVYAMRDEQRKSRPAMARIFTSGRGFTSKGGYPTQAGGIPGVPYEIASAAEAAASVDELAGHAPDVVKIWVDDHFHTLPKLSLDLSKAIIDRAHAKSLRAVAHIFYRQDAQELMAAGLDAFAHSVRDQPIDDAFIAEMKRRGTWLMSPTLAREASMFAFATPAPFVNDPFFAKAVPPKVLARLSTPEFQSRLTADPHWREYPGYLKTAQQNLKRLVDGGIRVGFGTDTGPPSRFGGYGEHWEMALMVEAGLTPMQVIVAATRNSADFLGAKDLGTLEPGKWADLIVLRANPLENIRNTRQIEAVYIAGNRIQ